MATCEFCKNTIQDKMPCPYCGTVIATAIATFVYGQTKKQTHACEVVVTDKYIIVRSISKKEAAATIGATVASVGFGVLGVLAAAGINKMTNKKCYGYYDLADVQKAIFPYHNDIYQKEASAIKIINKDGTDFIIHLNRNAEIARTFAEGLAKAGVYVENGSASNYGHVFCSQPFVDENTFGTRVCQSAAAFVQLDKRQFVVSSNTAETASNQYQVMPQMVQPQATTSEKLPTIENNSFDTKQVAACTEGIKVCPGCGKQFDKPARFCTGCGHAFAKIESTSETKSVPEWNADQWESQWRSSVRVTSEFEKILIPDSVFNSENHRIPDDDRLDDDCGRWYLLEKIENLASAIESLSKQQHQEEVYVRVLTRPSLSSQQIKMCRNAKINIIVLERELLDTRPTERFFWNATLDAYYRDWYYQGYGSVDDAETVWWRRIDPVSCPEAVSAETWNTAQWKSQW